jgi:hypothetical protein
MPVDLHLIMERCDDALGEQLRFGRSLNALLDDGEFIAAEACHGIAFAHAREQPVCHHLQHAVADRVAQRVVDDLEAIQIEKEDRTPGAPPDCNHGLFQPLVEQYTVG